VDNWYGMVVPARTPPAVIRRLRDELVKAMTPADVRDRLIALGQGPVGSTPEASAPS